MKNTIRLLGLLFLAPLIAMLGILYLLGEWWHNILPDIFFCKHCSLNKVGFFRVLKGRTLCENCTKDMREYARMYGK